MSGNIIIDGVTYSVPIMSIEETADILDMYAYRTIDGVLHREVIGTFFNYSVQFGRNAATSEIAALWLKITEPIDSHTITLPDEDGTTRTFSGYFGTGAKRALSRMTDTKTFWKTLQVTIVSVEPSRTP